MAKKKRRSKQQMEIVHARDSINSIDHNTLEFKENEEYLKTVDKGIRTLAVSLFSDVYTSHVEDTVENWLDTHQGTRTLARSCQLIEDVFTHEKVVANCNDLLLINKQYKNLLNMSFTALDLFVIKKDFHKAEDLHSKLQESMVKLNDIIMSYNEKYPLPEDDTIQKVEV